MVFCTADFWHVLSYESAEQKPKHCQTWGLETPIHSFTPPPCPGVAMRPVEMPDQPVQGSVPSRPRRGCPVQELQGYPPDLGHDSFEKHLARVCGSENGLRFNLVPDTSVNELFFDLLSVRYFKPKIM